LPLEQIFNITEKLPLSRVFLRNINLTLHSKQLGMDIEAHDSAVMLSNLGKNLTAKVDAPQLQASLKELGHFEGSFDTHLLLNHQSLKIIHVGVKLDESELVANGELTDFKNVTILPTGVIDASAKIDLSNLYSEIKKFNPTIKMPTFSGDLKTEFQAHFKGFNELRAKTDITTHQILIDKFELGDAQIQANLRNKALSLSQIALVHPAGKIFLNDSTVNLEKDFAFKTRIKSDEIDLQKFFASINLPQIPVGLTAKGELPCSGQLRGDISVDCSDVQVGAKDIWVKIGNKDLLNVDDFQAEGDVHADMEKFSYKANMVMGKSKGTSEGVVKYREGFQIKYKTDQLNFADVRNLAHLKFEGQAAVEGTTSGNAKTAIFDLKAQTQELVFENYNLGNVNTDISYRQGHMFLQHVDGALTKTHFTGGVDVNFLDSQISGDVTMDSVDLVDLQKVFERIYRLPFDSAGGGVAKAHFSGPLDFWKMNYHAESSFKNIILGGENFESLVFNVEANKGNITAKQVVLQKNGSNVVVNGSISPEQAMNLTAIGKNWKLEESALINHVNSSILGNLNFKADIKGTVLQPQVVATGEITDTVLEDQEIADSTFTFHSDKNSLSGLVSLFGDKVKGNFQLPYRGSTAPLVMKMKTLNWNYSVLAALVGGANFVGEYDSSLTSNIDIRSDSGELAKVTGRMSVQNLYLKRGELSLSNKTPLEITAENGIFHFKNFNLAGPHNELQIKGDRFTAENLNIGVNANLDLRLLQIFMPFLEDLGGPMQLSATVSGKVTKPELLGNASLRNAFIKIKGLPHPLEKLQADVVFSHTKILLNSIQGQFAGGRLSGDGGLLINGTRDIPTSIRINLDNVSLNVPEKVHTTGNAELLLSGKWFPFTLSGTYRVSSGFVDREFTEGTSTVSDVKQSLYLPKVLKAAQFEALNFDVQIIMEQKVIVKNSLFNGYVTGTLQVKGTPSRPILLGKINVQKPSQLIFKDKNFDVQNGLIQFNDPTDINPDVYLLAQSRINDYDVTLLVQGAAKSPVIRPTSVPPLSDQDIISLIALGITTSDSVSQRIYSRNQNAQSQADANGMEIGAATLAQPLAKQLQNKLGVDLKFSSQYDSVRNISVPRVIVSRMILPKVVASSSRSLSNDDQSYDVKLEYLINNNLTAVGSFENQSVDDSILANQSQQYLSFFGLDLEFKREFK